MMIKDGIDLETGEVVTQKPYETEKHMAIKTEIAKQIAYVNSTLKDEAGKLARLDGDVLSMVLIELTAYYQYLYSWIADERLHLSDIKSAYEIKFAREYVRLKSEGQTNETARHLSKIFCEEDDQAINLYKHGLDVVIAWEKSTARYIDAVRSQLSYTKSVGQYNQ